MGRMIYLGVAALLAAGCTQIQLKRSTLRQASTLTDLQYSQVLNNLAMFACNPEALPWHVKLRGGVVQVTDVASASLAAELPTEGPRVYMPAVTGERGIVGQWDVEPTVEAGELDLLRLAYQMALRPGDLELRKEVYHAICNLSVEFRVLPSEKTVLTIWRLFGAGAEQPPDEVRLRAAEIRRLYRAAREEALLPARERPRARKLLALMHEWCAEGHLKLGPEEVAASHNLAEIEQVIEKIEKLQDLLEKPQFQIPWLFVGGKKDVPKCACYVGCYCDCHKHCCYVWVTPDQYKTLREFTLIVLALAPLERQEIPTFGPVFSAAGLR